MTTSDDNGHVERILYHLECIRDICAESGLHLFAGGQMQIRKRDERSAKEGALVLGSITMPCDGGCGATHTDSDDNERGEP